MYLVTTDSEGNFTNTHLLFSHKNFAKSLFLMTRNSPGVALSILTKTHSILYPCASENILPEIGELNTEKIALAISKVIGLKVNGFKLKSLDLPKRTARLCEGCPYWFVFPTIKKAVPEDPYFRLICDNKLDVFWKAHARNKPGLDSFFSDDFKDLTSKMF